MAENSIVNLGEKEKKKKAKKKKNYLLANQIRPDAPKNHYPESRNGQS